uniref:RNA-directed DNA polymerase, eukaryota, reverse transcriptase zinc-binding domain protein n=1 Tax=Lactuca sativa TaxID=4236 RepID=A0A9R1UEB1_LACSA|nr:hypothetical protein LSAT_V11C900460230 [Lactuca sativa]
MGFWIFYLIYRVLWEKNAHDHRPILLLEHRGYYRSVPFRVFSSWFYIDVFDEVVRNSWAQDQGRMESSHPWFLKSNIRLWNTTSRVRLGSKLMELQQVLESIDASLMGDRRVTITKDITNLDHITNLDLAQKAKIQWGIEGDENSCYFHGYINRKRRPMAIRGDL